ncbi:unnamed protein product [Cochlearia groenlandica]
MRKNMKRRDLNDHLLLRFDSENLKASLYYLKRFLIKTQDRSRVATDWRHAYSRAPSLSTIFITKFGGAMTSLDLISSMHLSTSSMASSTDMSLR